MNAGVATATFTATYGELGLYPNPAHASTMLQIPTVPGATQAILTLTDAPDRVLRTEVIALPTAGLRHELNVASLPAGLCALRMQVGTTTISKRLVVQ